jgi:hypothetical protein
MQPEAKLVKRIQTLIEVAGGRPFKIQGQDESFQEAGIPDILACLWGFFVGVEVKQPGAKLRPLQRVVLHEIYHSGGVAAIVETVQQAELLLQTIEERGNLEEGLLFCRGEYLPEWGPRFK